MNKSLMSKIKRLLDYIFIFHKYTYYCCHIVKKIIFQTLFKRSKITKKYLDKRSLNANNGPFMFSESHHILCFITKVNNAKSFYLKNSIF